MGDKIPNYIIKFIKQFPESLSGRKNFKKHHGRILKTLKLIKNYSTKSKN